MLDSLIGGAVKLLGGYLGDKSTERATAANIAAENQRNAENVALQREFAQSGIQWKVEDAKKAGIHPAYALGAQTTSFSPQQVGALTTAKTGLSGAMSDMGQDVERAVYAASPAARRQEAFTRATQQLTLEKGALENEALRQDIASKSARMRQSFNASKPVPTNELPAFSGTKVPTADANDPQKAPPLPEHVGLRAGGTWLHHPKWSDAQKYEDRYGEIGEFAASPLIFGADMWHNIRNTVNMGKFYKRRSREVHRPSSGW